jgi:hypothetical protein
MACNKCKQKEKLTKEMLKSNGETPREVKLFFLIFGFLSIYGLISFGCDLVKWVF